ncbi:hypothetical protein OQA88_1787 [Cercophora sp. LCS_1]
MASKSRAAFAEQHGADCGNIRPGPPPRKRTWLGFTTTFATVVLLALYHHLRGCYKPRILAAAPILGSSGLKTSTFSWADIPPSRSLIWHPCYAIPEAPGASLDCARLDVPMDWQSPGDDERVVLAVVRLRANSSLGSYRGPVFFNPGGPGGSGIWALRDRGRDLQAIVGEDHDIIGFDPRGVGASTPRIDCWGGRMQDRLVWGLQDVGVVDAHPGVVYDALARASILSAVCEENQEGSILRHSSTAYHARDMLEILEQMGEKKIKYWGFSYGTVLGGTFAAMYPDRIERMVNDGNVDYEEWYNGTYFAFLHDADLVMEAFHTFCHLAGPLRCAFYAPSPSQIHDRLSALLDTIRLSPIPIPTTLAPTPSLVTYSSVKQLLSTALYQPIYRFPRVATVLAALERRDPAPYVSYTSLDNPNPIPFCSAETTPPTDTSEDTPDAFPAIMCADAEPFTDSPAQFADYVATLLNISHAAGAVQAGFRLACAGRNHIRPKWRFEGPVVGGNTSFPILFVNNVADNVTPLVSARRNAAGFEGSVVLMQNSYGHTSLAAASRCTAGWVRGYFREGRMPGVGTVCEADGVPFGERAGLSSGEVDGEEEDRLVMAVRRLERGFGRGRYL